MTGCRSCNRANNVEALTLSKKITHCPHQARTKGRSRGAVPPAKPECPPTRVKKILQSSGHAP